MSEEFGALQDAADAGRADAQALVGGLALEYMDDPAAALYYFRPAADAGDPAGLRGLGHLLANGIGLPQDLGEAAELFGAAAAAGDAIAAFNLGTMLLNGIGVAADESRALGLLRSAATAGVPAAAALLADWHADRSEYAQARSFYRDAANGGVPTAMLTLGQWCGQGIGGEVDKIEAVRWLLEPLGLGDGDGVHDAIGIARTMTDDEIREAGVRAGREAYAEALITTVRRSG